MKQFLIAIVLISFPVVANAQRLHGHPQLAAYSSISQYPTISAQEHWRLDAGRIIPDNTCALAATDDLTCAHIHNDLTCPYLAEFNAGDIARCNFSITLHHFPGYVTAMYPGFLHYAAVTVVWDSTGNSNPPIMVGDPNSDLVFTGHFTAPLPPNSKGWWFLTNEVKFHLNDGKEGSPELLIAIWSNLNPPNADFSYHLPMVRAASNLSPSQQWGQLTIEYDGLLPILPISQNFDTLVSFYSYGRPLLKPGVDEIHYDMDLHHEIRGRTVFSVTQAEDLGMPWTFDPNVIGGGTHKVAAFRVQPDDNNEQLTTVLVINVAVGDSVPVEPPPVIDWHNISGVLQRLNDSIRICDPIDSKCLVLGIVQ